MLNGIGRLVAIASIGFFSTIASLAAVCLDGTAFSHGSLMYCKIVVRCLGLFAANLLALACMGQEIVATPLKATGVYDIGENVEWRVEIKVQPTPPINEAKYVLKKGGLTVLRSGTLDLSAGSATLQTSLDEAGT